MKRTTALLLLAVFLAARLAGGAGSAKSNAHEDIRTLLHREYGTELLKTLRAYLDSGESVSRTAARLQIHRNTITYRIAKCREITGLDLEDGNELFKAAFSLRLLEYEAASGRN